VRAAVYLEFARVACLKRLGYRLRYFTGIVTYFLNVTVYYFIWRAVYSASSSPAPGRSVAGNDAGQMITYVAVGWLLRSFYFNNVDRDLAAEVVEGKIAVVLIKPVDPQLMYLAQAAGESVFRLLLFTVPITAVILLVYPVAPPRDPASAAAFGCSCVLALAIFALLNFIVGTMALQLQSILGVIRAKYFIVEFTSGLLIPLQFFPERLARVLQWLPFSQLSYTPLQLYLGKWRGAAALEALALQLAWAVALFVGGRIYWGFSTRRLSIQGG